MVELKPSWASKLALSLYFSDALGNQLP